MGQDLDTLQGAWNIVSLEMDGEKMPGGVGGVDSGRQVISPSAYVPLPMLHASKSM